MNRDARLVIRAKQQQKQRNQIKGLGRKIVDARQIIKQKMRNSSPYSNQTSSYPVRKFNGVMQKVNRQNRFSRPNIPRQMVNTGGRGRAKKVFVGRAGILKITSKGQKRFDDHMMDIRNKCIVSDQSGITVTMRNKPLSHVSFDDRMDEDDLERISLQDLPEVPNVKAALHSRGGGGGGGGLFSSPKMPVPTTSHSMSFSNRLLGGESTMIADAIAASSMSSSQPSWKVLVTNLHPSVTQEDIFELFGSVGSMKGSELVRPGLALVEYYTKRDALLACDTYHNRLLDGQPMQCTIETESQPSRPPITMRLGEKCMTTLNQSARYPRQTASSIFSQSSGGSSSFGGRGGVEFTVKVP